MKMREKDAHSTLRAITTVYDSVSQGSDAPADFLTTWPGYLYLCAKLGVAVDARLMPGRGVHLFKGGAESI